MAAGLGAVLFVTALAAAAAALVLHGKRAPVHCRDAEPNDSPATAVPIAPGDRVAGTLGKRLSATESDHDWFVLQIPPGEPALARIHLRRVPGVDTMLELFRSGDKEAVASARAGGAGKDEAISGVMLDPGLYYVLVRQDLARGGRPVESISDGYELTVTLQDPAGFETEPNDTFQTACNISVPAVIEGFVQSPSDRDVYCVRPSGAAALTARLGGPHDLLLSLSAVDVATGKWTTVAASAGTSEILMTDLACDGTEGLCLQVAPADGGYDVSTSYTLSLE